MNSTMHTSTYNYTHTHCKIIYENSDIRNVEIHPTYDGQGSKTFIMLKSMMSVFTVT